MDWTTIIGLGAACIGAIYTLIKAAVAISTRLEARKKRAKDGRLKEIADAVEAKQRIATSDKETHELLVEHLWQVIKDQKEEIKELEKDGKLTRPVIKQLYSKLRAMRDEIERSSLTPEEAKPLKTLLAETEELLP